MTFSAMDHGHMAHSLRLAERGLYTTQPNPRVGCVIAHRGEVVGNLLRRANHGAMAATRRKTRSEEHTSELQSLMRTSYAVFCLKKKKSTQNNRKTTHNQHTYMNTEIDK